MKDSRKAFNSSILLYGGGGLLFTLSLTLLATGGSYALVKTTSDQICSRDLAGCYQTFASVAGRADAERRKRKKGR